MELPPSPAPAAQPMPGHPARRRSPARQPPPPQRGPLPPAAAAAAVHSRPAQAKGREGSPARLTPPASPKAAAAQRPRAAPPPPPRRTSPRPPPPAFGRPSRQGPGRRRSWRGARAAQREGQPRALHRWRRRRRLSSAVTGGRAGGAKRQQPPLSRPAEPSSASASGRCCCCCCFSRGRDASRTGATDGHSGREGGREPSPAQLRRLATGVTRRCQSQPPPLPRAPVNPM